MVSNPERLNNIAYFEPNQVIMGVGSPRAIDARFDRTSGIKDFLIMRDEVRNLFTLFRVLHPADMYPGSRAHLELTRYGVLLQRVERVGNGSGYTTCDDYCVVPWEECQNLQGIVVGELDEGSQETD